MGIHESGDTRHYSDTVVRDDVQFSEPTVIEADVAAGTAFDTSEVENVEVWFKTHEFFRSAMTGANNDFQIIAREGGDSDVTIALVDPSENDAALSIEVTGEDIVVNLATGPAGAITTTATQLVAALNSTEDSHVLVHAELAPGNSGAGIVTALSEQPVGNIVGTLDATIQTSVDGTNYNTLGTFTQKSTFGQEARVFGPVGIRTRINYDITGASAAFGLSVAVKAHK